MIFIQISFILSYLETVLWKWDRKSLGTRLWVFGSKIAKYM